MGGYGYFGSSALYDGLAQVAESATCTRACMPGIGNYIYLDLRSRNGFENASVFLVEIHRELAKKGGGIVASCTSEIVSKALKVHVVKEYKMDSRQTT